jgi:hypothetical protein
MCVPHSCLLSIASRLIATRVLLWQFFSTQSCQLYALDTRCEPGATPHVLHKFSLRPKKPAPSPSVMRSAPSVSPKPVPSPEEEEWATAFTPHDQLVRLVALLDRSALVASDWKGTVHVVCVRFAVM